MTKTIVNDVMFNRRAKITPRATEKNVFANEFFNLAYWCTIDMIGNSVNVFYKANTELAQKYRDIYPNAVNGHKRLVMTVEMVSQVLGEKHDIIKYIEDEGMFVLSNYCLNALYPEARPYRIEGGVLRKNARAGGYICPYCKKPLDMSLEGVENAHAISQDGVGNRMDSVSLFAAHKECNAIAGLRSVLAHYEVLGLA